MSNIDEIKGKLQWLRLNKISIELEHVLKETTQKNVSSLAFLEKLLNLEMEHRRDRSIANRIRQAKLPHLVTIDQFDFNHHNTRSQNKQLILKFLDLAFLENKTDIVFMGNPGVGKSFLAECIGLEACRHNVRVLFAKAMDVVNYLMAADADHSLYKKLDYYRKPQLLILDELGYLSLNQQGSDLLFQV